MAVFIPRFLRHLRDVDETGVADGDSLTYDSGTETWVPGAGGGGGDVTDAVILAPASSARNVILPANGDTIAAIIKSHADWQTGSAAGDMLDFQDENGVLMAGFVRNQVDDTRSFFIYDDVNQDAAAFFSSKGWEQYVGTGSTYPPIWIKNQDGSVDLFKVLPSGAVLISPNDPAVIAAIVKAHAAQSVDLTQWQSSAGAVLASINEVGGLLIDNTDSTRFSLEIQTPGLTSDFGEVMQIVNGSGQQIFYLASNGYAEMKFDPGAGAIAWTAIGGPIGMYMDAFQGFAVTNGNVPATYFWWVNPDGYEAIASNTEPADGDIQPGEVFSWYDDSNGAAFFYRKGKTADGTVVKTRAAMGAAYTTPYVVGGTDVALADGGTGASLADPNADRIMFWDDSAGAVTWLTAGTGLSITGTTIEASASGSGEALARAISQAGHGLAVGDIVRHNGTAYVKAQADSEANAEVAGIVSVVADANNFTLHYSGRITGLSGLTAGTVYYLDDDTAGLLTATEPSDVGDVSKPLLIADSTTTGYFVNFRGAIVAAGGDSVAESLFDANTVLKADSDDTPVALTMGASTILARLASGSIKAASVAEIVTLLGAYVSGGTDVALADGGTGASTAATARANLQAATRRTSGYKVGQYYYGECLAAGGLGGTGPNGLNTVFYVPFIVDVTTTFDRIACFVSANGSAGSVVRMGILNDNNGVPGTVLLDAGTVATDAGAPVIKAITISQQLTPGIYWTAVVAQVAVPTVRRCIALGTMQWLSTDFNGSAIVLTGETGALSANPAVTVAVSNPTTCALRALSSP